MVWNRETALRWLGRFGRFVRRMIFAALWLGVIAWTLGSTAYAINWIRFREPQPPRTPITEELFEGVTYERLIKDEIRPTVIHLVHIDLETADPVFFVTPPHPAEVEPDLDRLRFFEDAFELDRLDVQARQTTEFLDEFELDIAINASFFFPIGNLPFAFYTYPVSGDPLGVLGQTVSGSVPFETEVSPTTFCVYADRSIEFQRGRCSAAPAYAVGGYSMFMENGRFSQDGAATDGSYRFPFPRTALGLNADQTVLTLIAVDGRQPQFSQGITWEELSEILAPLGIDQALGLDGGGSTTLVVRGEEGPLILNSPVHRRIPGHERPVATHIGFRFEE